MLAKKLKNYRRRYGRSQESVARQCKLRTATIRDYEARLKQPTMTDIEKICEGLGWGYTVRLKLMEWLSVGGIYHTKQNRKVLNDEAMRLIQKMEKKYGNMTKTPDDDPDLLTVQEIIGTLKEDDTDD